MKGVFMNLKIRKSYKICSIILIVVMAVSTVAMTMPNNGLTKEKMINEGFTEKKVTQMMAKVDRISFQLKEIISYYNQSIVNAVSDIVSGDMDKYRTIYDQFDVDLAIRLTLELENTFGDGYAVLDEYLAAIQLGIDIQVCVGDAAIYKGQKVEAQNNYTKGHIITMFDMEEMMHEIIEEKNKCLTEAIDTETNEPFKSEELLGIIKSDGLKENIEAEIQEIEPTKPMENVMTEVKEVKDSSFTTDLMNGDE